MKDNKWTHSICPDCWDERYPNHVPFRITVVHPKEHCCFCGKDSTAGIYVREDIANAPFCEYKEADHVHAEA